MAAEYSKRIAWGISGSGHYLRECLEIINARDDIDVFLSRAADEIIRQYGFALKAEKVFYDKTASSVPVEFFYQARYHTVVIAPATSNTVAKMVYGFSDTLVTNIFAQAGKCRVPSIVFACDTAPELESEAPRDHMVKVYPRNIDLQNAQKLRDFEATQVVADMAELQVALQQRLLQTQI